MASQFKMKPHRLSLLSCAWQTRLKRREFQKGSGLDKVLYIQPSPKKVNVMILKLHVYWGVGVGSKLVEVLNEKKKLLC